MPATKERGACPRQYAAIRARFRAARIKRAAPSAQAAPGRLAVDCAGLGRQQGRQPPAAASGACQTQAAPLGGQVRMRESRGVLAGRRGRLGHPVGYVSAATRLSPSMKLRCPSNAGADKDHPASTHDPLRPECLPAKQNVSPVPRRSLNRLPVHAALLRYSRAIRSARSRPVSSETAASAS